MVEPLIVFEASGPLGVEPVEGKKGPAAQHSRASRRGETHEQGPKTDDREKFMYRYLFRRAERPDVVDNKHSKEKGEHLSHDVYDNEYVSSNASKSAPLFSVGENEAEGNISKNRHRTHDV